MLGFAAACTLRTETPVATTATPSSRTISPMICDPSWLPVSEIGLVAATATAPWPGWAPGPVVGAWLGTADGVICGNRLAALPAGTLTVCPDALEPMIGSAPIGMAAAPTPPVNPAPRPLAVPSGLDAVPPRLPEAELPEAELPEAEPPDDEPPDDEPPDVEPREGEAATDFGLAAGLGDAGAAATVTAGAPFVAVRGGPLP